MLGKMHQCSYVMRECKVGIELLEDSNIAQVIMECRTVQCVGGWGNVILVWHTTGTSIPPLEAVKAIKRSLHFHIGHC